MVKNTKLLEKYERNQHKKSKVNIKQNLKIAEAMYQYAKPLQKSRTNKFPEKKRIVYKIAKIINSV